jgi:hypothetical protein
VSEVVVCPEHGDRAATIVCKHVLETLRDGERRGFRWSIDEDGEYQAFCSECDARSELLSQSEWDDLAGDIGRVLCLECFRRAATLNAVHLPGA